MRDRETEGPGRGRNKKTERQKKERERCKKEKIKDNFELKRQVFAKKSVTYRQTYGLKSDS